MSVFGGSVVVAVVLTLGADATSTEPLLLLVSFDGFRWDYLDQFQPETPNFHYLVSNGVRARKVINVMPTVTYPNHYTILTGSYPETHGVVANFFYDPKLNRTYNMFSETDQTDPVWYDTGVEPIWVTNQISDPVSRLSGTILFPDSLAPVKTVAPNYIIGPLPWDEHIMKFKDRVNKMLEWFTLSDMAINLGLLYFEEPDHTGHGHGPNSEEMRMKVKELDSLLGYLIERLRQEGLFDIMNIIITADHGMAETLPRNHIDIYKYVNSSLYNGN